MTCRFGTIRPLRVEPGPFRPRPLATTEPGVSSLIGEALPKTLILVGLATVLALMIAIPMGIYQVVRRNKPEDYVLTGVSFIFYAMPAFLLGTLLILWFAIYIPIFSIEARRATSIWGILCRPKALVLPVVTLRRPSRIASFSRYMRSSMMETMTEDFIRTARAKGAAPGGSSTCHALRNAIIPIVTLLGLSLGTIVSGAVITESVFNSPAWACWPSTRPSRRTSPRCSASPSSSPSRRSRAI